MKLNEKISGTIGRLASDGSGLIEQPIGKQVRVYNTIDNEDVTAVVTRREKTFMRAKLASVETPSPHRIAPRCPYAGTCGGCKWQHIDYPHQLAAKAQLLRDAFAQAEIPCSVVSPTGATDLFYYRNRMDFVFGANGELGMKEPGSWRSVIDLKTCFLLSPETVEILNRVRDWSRSTGLPFWNGATHDGFFRYVVIREGKRTGNRMVVLVTGAPISNEEKSVKSIANVIGDLATSVVWGINPLITDLSIAQTVTPLKGDPWIHEIINGIGYKITPNAFFQTNTVMAEQLQNTVAELCGDLKDKTLLDLYCGSGFFSLALANKTKRTIGIELDSEAIASAKENAVVNGKKVDYFVSKAEAFDWTNESPDVVIIDPPRAGLHPKVIETILSAKPKTMIYVSCKYERFLQECKQLLAVYNIVESRALDLFPHTPHVEIVTKFERK